MKYLKLWGLAVLVAVPSMLLPGAASATVMTCLPGSHCPPGTVIHAESEGVVIFHTPFGAVECLGSTFKARTANTGGPDQTVHANVEAFNFVLCNGVVQVINTGALEFHTLPGGSATVTSTGLTITVERQGFHCIYATNQTDLGTLTGSTVTGATPTLDIQAAVPREGGRSGFFCGAQMEWTAAYRINEPDWLDFD